SRRRAEAVRNYLISKGISSHLISAEGRGSREPLIECQGNAITASLKQCLQPNRRVQIMIYGQRWKGLCFSARAIGRAPLLAALARRHGFHVKQSQKNLSSNSAR